VGRDGRKRIAQIGGAERRGGGRVKKGKGRRGGVGRGVGRGGTREGEEGKGGEEEKRGQGREGGERGT